MRDPVTGLADTNGSDATGWDLELDGGGANRPPVFRVPHPSGTALSAKAGQELTLAYDVSDPDGEPKTPLRR